MKPRKVYILLTLILAALLPGRAYGRVGNEIYRLVADNPELFNPREPILDPDLVIVNGDTIPLKLRTRNLGRHDRGLFNYLFIPKGQWMFGLTASYGEINTEDIELLSILTNVDLNGKTYSIKPSVSWFFNHNQSVGMKINYTRAEGNLGSLGLDMGDDLSFTLRDVKYNSESYAAGITYRAYVGLDRNKRFAVFNEADLNLSTGHSHFSRLYNDEPKLTRTRSNEVSLNFSPGVCDIQDKNFSLSGTVRSSLLKKSTYRRRLVIGVLI